jgi:hypothetical protein
MAEAVCIHLTLYQLFCVLLVQENAHFYFHSCSQPPYHDEAKKLRGTLTLLTCYSCFSIFVMPVEVCISRSGLNCIIPVLWMCSWTVKSCSLLLRKYCFLVVTVELGEPCRQHMDFTDG